ncbi:MAG: SIS domain-containing protein [Pseudomonadota bacterium]
MDVAEVWLSGFSQAEQLLKAFQSDPALLNACHQFTHLLHRTFLSDHKVFACGNGGSHCDALHFSEEWTGRFLQDRRPLGAFTLGEASHLSCVSNDFGFEQVFSRQLEGLGRSGDLLLCLSTSGNSTNILAALRMAKALGIHSVALLGKDGGKAKGLADLSIVVPHGLSHRIQEMHIKIIHTVIESVERLMFPHLYVQYDKEAQAAQ